MTQTRPDKTSIHRKAEELAAQLPSLLVAAERVASTVSQGVHGRRRIGQGEAFWQFRRYQHGDAVNSIDWRRSAKSDNVYVRENEWEAAESIWLWRNASSSMFYNSSPSLVDKANRADVLLLALATLLSRGGEQIALLGDGRPPATGGSALQNMASALTSETTIPDGELPPRIHLPKYVRVVLISDFLTPLQDISALVRAYASAGIRGHLLQVLDPAEESLPFSGRVRFQGPEGDGDVLFGRTENVRNDYRKALQAHRTGLQALAATSNWTFALHHTDNPPEMALMSLYKVLSETSGAMGA